MQISKVTKALAAIGEVEHDRFHLHDVNGDKVLVNRWIVRRNGNQARMYVPQGASITKDRLKELVEQGRLKLGEPADGESEALQP